MVDIVVINWNGGWLLHNCVSAILDAYGTATSGKLIIIDNASTDHSLQRLPKDSRIKLILNTKNLGFAKACNQGFEKCTTEYILLLNPDAALSTGCLQSCISYMNINKETGILGVRLLDEHGNTTPSCARFPTPLRILQDATGLSKLFPRRFKPSTLMTDWDHRESRYVDQVMGAFMFMRRTLFDKLGYFDERFFVYYEELDFSKRLADAGGKTFFNTDITALHVGEGTTQNVKAFRLFLSLRSRLQYAHKHFKVGGYALVWIATWMVEPVSRIVMHMAKRKWKDAGEVWKGYKLLLRNKLPQQ